MRTYVADSDALINFHRHYPNGRNHLRIAIKHGSVIVPGGVRRELIRASDALSRMLEKLATNVVEVDTPITKEIFSQIQVKYGPPFRAGRQMCPGLFRSRAGAKAADAQVAALAKAHGWTAVTNDKTLTVVCMLEQVECVGWTEFARSLLPPEQLSLFA